MAVAFFFFLVYAASLLLDAALHTRLSEGASAVSWPTLRNLAIVTCGKSARFILARVRHHHP